MATLGKKKPDIDGFQLTGHASKYQETDRAVLLLWTFVKKWLGSQEHRRLEGGGSHTHKNGRKRLGISYFSKERQAGLHDLSSPLCSAELSRFFPCCACYQPRRLLRPPMCWLSCAYLPLLAFAPKFCPIPKASLTPAALRVLAFQAHAANTGPTSVSSE